MKIGDFNLDEQVLVVAEIGNNHEGSFELAVRMIDLAAEAGADAVKFQTLRADKLVSRADRTRFERLKRFELTYAQFEKLAERSRRCGVIFLSTPFDLESARFINTLCPALKIASGDNNFTPLLEQVARFQKPILLSTGAADLDRVGRAKATVEEVWSSQGCSPGLVLLHCVSAYPTPPEEANLSALDALRDHFHCPVGYSDHVLGIEAAILAVARGARVIEKHFTIDKSYSDFRDHQLSADPTDMAELVRRVRQIQTLLGDGVKRLQPSERPVANAVQRRIVAAMDIAPDTVIELQHLNWIRTPEGLPAGQETELLGRKTQIGLSAGDPILPEHLAPLASYLSPVT